MSSRVQHCKFKIVFVIVLGSDTDTDMGSLDGENLGMAQHIQLKFGIEGAKFFVCFCSGSFKLQIRENVFFTPVKYTLVCCVFWASHTLWCVLISAVMYTKLMQKCV